VAIAIVIEQRMHAPARRVARVVRAGVLPSALQVVDGERPRLGSPALATYRSSLSICWTDASCKRVMAVAHGGAWSALGAPYDSNAALAAAYAQGVDGVKIDVRVTKDNVPIISHSSPIMIYESLDCANKKIEEMTAAEVTKCHRFPSGTETFQRLDEVLEYLRDKMVVELTVKRSGDYARTIQEVLALRASDFAYLEISTSELRDLIPKLSGSDRVYYLVNVGSKLAEVDEIIDKIKNPRAFMVEIDPGVAIGSLISTRLHPAGLRAFIYDKSGLLASSQIKAYYNQGFDVVSSNQARNGVTARQQVNTARGVTPP
jgi:glycerophosphoryl diester phosphodiesterase